MNLTTQKISPFDSWRLNKAYFPTIDEQEKIDFVIKMFDLPRSGFNTSIVEDADAYKIHIDNDTSFGHYSIDKITGKEFINEAIEGNYEPMPHEDSSELINTDFLIEIKV